MTNEEAKIHLQSAKLMLLGADGQPVSDLYYAVEKGIEALETIPKYKDAYNKGWDDGAKATYEHLKMCEEEQGGDLISRDMALEKMADYVASGYANSVEDFEEYSRIICQLPSVNSQEPKTGHWIDKFAGVYRCSCCRETIEIDTEIDYPNGITFNYCPNCGTRMKSEE